MECAHVDRVTIEFYSLPLIIRIIYKKICVESAYNKLYADYMFIIRIIPNTGFPDDMSITRFIIFSR